MAAIEKIDELTGEYEGPVMYSQKKNSIQVLNKNKHFFRGAKAILTFYKPEFVELIDGKHLYRMIDLSNLNEDYYTYIGGVLHEWRMDRKRKDYELAFPIKLTKQHQFCLHVDAPELQGRVNGNYINWGFDKQTIIRKLSRLVGKKNLKIINKSDVELNKDIFGE